MGKKFFRKWIWAGLGLPLSFILLHPPILQAQVGGGQASIHKMRIQTAVPSWSLSFELLKRFKDRLAKISGGRLMIEILPEGASMLSHEILEGVDEGRIEGGYGWTHFWSGRHPAALLFSAPIGGAGRGLDQMAHLAWLYEGGGRDLLNHFYAEILRANVLAFPIHPLGPDALGWFKRPIVTLSDIKKLKYASPPGIMSEVLREMGILPVTLAPNEILSAAQRGVIDGAKWMGPADGLQMGFPKIWKYYYLQGLHQSTDIGELLIHKGFWNRLSPDLQEMIHCAVRSSISETLVFCIERQSQALRILKERHQVEVRDTPEEFYEEYIRSSRKILEHHATRDPFFRKVLASQEAFADLVAPYWTKALQLYRILGEKGPRDRGGR